MRKRMGKGLILTLFFLLGLVVTGFLMNSETTYDRSDMNDATFPELMISFDGIYANRMCGYAQEMQADFVRECITPIDTTKKVTFAINPYDAEVSSLSYEIRSSDDSKIIENRIIKNLTEKDSYLEATVEIGCDLLMSQEYTMQITLAADSREIYYYTRIISRSNLNTGDYVQFVKSFYEKCMDKATADDLSTYLEPLATEAATNFAQISIQSTLAEISWGSLKPQITRKGIPVINDINETTASVSIDYQISAKNSNGLTVYYNVSEFYRMRMSDTRIMLLDFQRSTNQIFDAATASVSENGLMLGIREKDVTCMANDDGSALVFVQQGALWSYCPQTGKTARIFSFRKDSGGDFRDIRQDHDIKLIRVTDEGNVDFVLYGYMNRGNHEGYTGVCAYHYDAALNVVEEMVFIPSTESYQFLKADMGTLSYVNENNRLYILLAGKLYEVNLTDNTYSVLEEGISSSSFAVSDSSAHAAWEIDRDGTRCIKEIDFDTKKTNIFTPAEGEHLQLYGFMNEDVILGVLLDTDTLTDKSNHSQDGITTLRILDFDGQMKKEYHQEGLYITDLTIGDTLMEFSLSKKSDNGYTYVKSDNIMNNKKAASSQISVSLVTISGSGVQVRLSLKESPDTNDVYAVYAKMRSTEEKVIALDTKEPQENVFYVYGKGSLDGIYTDPAKAVIRADEVTGVVLNRAQQYVWERGNKKTQQMLNLEDIPPALLEGIWDQNQLSDAIGEEGTILDLSRCTLDEVLYETSAQRPVIAKINDDSCVTIVGYDEYNTYLYYPDKKETVITGLNDSTALFEKAGNIFLAYLESKAS